MLITRLKQCLFIGLLAISPLNKNLSGSNPFPIVERNLPEIVIKPERHKQHRHHSKSLNFMGFRLQQALDTRVSNELKEMLLSYKGPTVRISSLRRYGTRSKHCCGKAVDLEWNTDLIDYLVSPEGTTWRDQWDLTFYIEAQPKDRILLPYKNNVMYKNYVFENPNATGPHIHLNLK